MASFSERDIVEPRNNQLVIQMIAQAMVASCFTQEVMTEEQTDLGARIERLVFRISDISIGEVGATNQQPDRLFVTGVLIDTGAEGFRVVNFSPDPSQPEARTRLTITTIELATDEPFSGPTIGQ